MDGPEAVFAEGERLLQEWVAQEDPPFHPLRLPTDEDSLPEERFPRQLTLQFVDDHRDPYDPECRMFLLDAEPNLFPDGPIQNYRGTGKTQGFRFGQLGDPLTDRSYIPDGYRFHDALHLTYMALLCYSPNTRSLLNVRRRSNRQKYKIDDGPRAISQEESMFNRLGMGRHVSGIVMPNSLRVEFAFEEGWNIKKVVPPGEGIPLRDNERALLIGVRLLCSLANTIGMIRARDYSLFINPNNKKYSAWVHLNLDERAVRFSLDGAEAAKEADPLLPNTKLFFADGQMYAS